MSSPEDFFSFSAFEKDYVCYSPEPSLPSIASPDPSSDDVIGMLEDEEENRIKAYREISLSGLLNDEGRAPCPWRREAIVREDPRFEAMFHVRRRVPAAETTPGQTIDPKLIFAPPDEYASEQKTEIKQDLKTRPSRKKKATTRSRYRAGRVKSAMHSSTKISTLGYRKVSQDSKLKTS